MVIDDQLNQRKLFAGYRREFVHIHAETTVSRDIHDHALRHGALRADGRTESKAHGAQAAACQKGSRVPITVVLRGPHLMLTDLGHDDGIVRRERIELPDDARAR